MAIEAIYFILTTFMINVWRLNPIAGQNNRLAGFRGRAGPINDGNVGECCDRGVDDHILASVRPNRRPLGPQPDRPEQDDRDTAREFSHWGTLPADA